MPRLGDPDQVTAAVTAALSDPFVLIAKHVEDDTDVIIDGDLALLGREEYEALVREVRLLRAENLGLRARPIYVPTYPPPLSPIWYGDDFAMPPVWRPDNATITSLAATGGLDASNGIGVD